MGHNHGAQFHALAGVTKYDPALMAAQTALEERAERMRRHFEQTGADVAERAAGEIRELRGLLAGIENREDGTE